MVIQQLLQHAGWGKSGKDHCQTCHEGSAPKYFTYITQYHYISRCAISNFVANPPERSVPEARRRGSVSWQGLG